MHIIYSQRTEWPRKDVYCVHYFRGLGLHIYLVHAKKRLTTPSWRYLRQKLPLATPYCTVVPTASNTTRDISERCILTAGSSTVQKYLRTPCSNSWQQYRSFSERCVPTAGSRTEVSQNAMFQQLAAVQKYLRTLCSNSWQQHRSFSERCILTVGSSIEVSQNAAF